MISLKNTLKAITSKFSVLNTLLNDVPHYTLLWTNPNPTSEFSAQTISLDLSKYDAIKIDYNAYGIKSEETYVGKSCRLSSVSPGGSSYYITARYRDCKVMTDGIKFDDGYTSYAVATPDTNNANCIPYKIYGIKFGGGYSLLRLLFAKGVFA